MVRKNLICPAVHDQDPRYDAIKLLIESGHIKSFREIFQFIPKTTVYKDLGINYNRFDRAISDPSIFRIQEVITLAELFHVQPKQLIDLTSEQAIMERKKTKKYRNK